MTVVVFWTALSFLVYTYIGYPLLLLVWSIVGKQRNGRGSATSQDTPSVSVILAVRNERANIARRLQNLLTQDYPPNLLEIYVASDGSTDGTNEITNSVASRRPFVKLISCSPEGKASAINSAVEQASGEILVFADARQDFDSRAIRKLASRFSDPSLGAVSGALTFRRTKHYPKLGVDAYWTLESWIRQTEARVGSTVGVTGAIYAARRHVYPRLPKGTLLDDVYAPMHIVVNGWRVGFESEALAYDVESESLRQEFGRKVRTLTGNYQLLRLLPRVLNPARNPLFLQFVSHKLLRLASPLLLAMLLMANLGLTSGLYTAGLGLQAALYSCGLLGLTSNSARRLAAFRLPTAFLVFNAAAGVALYNWITRRASAWI